jgi:alkylation response protein AidB-like acyl-CoA dehydrogenase
MPNVTPDASIKATPHRISPRLDEKSAISNVSAIADILNAPRNENDPFPREAWAALAHTGLFAEMARSDLEPAERISRTMVALEHLGEVCRDGGLSFSAVTHIASTISVLAQFGTASLVARFMPDLVAGSLIGAHAITELEAGSDALAMTCRAVPEADHYVITGDKAYVTNGPVADIIIVYAKTGQGNGVGDISAFAVPTNLPGVVRGPAMRKVGLWSSPLGALSLNKVRVPAEYRLGREGSGFFILSHVMKREILFAFTVNIGEMRHRLDDAVKFVNERHQFQSPIGAFQSISNRLADMKIRYELSKSFLHQTATRLATNRDVTSDIAIAKIFVSESAISTSLDALHLHGARGFLTETGLGVDICNAVGGTIYSGTNDIQRSRIAALMGVNV